MSPALIDKAYQASGNKLGWRLLYSPEKTLEGSKVAFVGLNPGGRHFAPEDSQFSPENGSAYVNERWGSNPPGESRLQIQVRTLFSKIEVEPCEVLAGNLVPFRSPDWNSLKNRASAVAFGTELWRGIFQRAQPSLVIAMGGVVGNIMANIYAAKKYVRIPVGWGNVAGKRYELPDKSLVVLPHLSRFPIITRDASQQGLARLFEPWWRV